ncbi:hypothetical protein [Sphingomonas citricola]|uniref:hypothetical protein n=1 Tax=Sphingomonas citricola TaxID=2862498 RepID=UPI0021562EE1|nr:hypothetical protein [Sphingomonas citricola]
MREQSLRVAAFVRLENTAAAVSDHPGGGGIYLLGEQETTMRPYTNDELLKGIGAFEHAMNAQTDVPGFRKRTSPATAIGILASMMRSGLSATKIDQVIDSEFAADAPLLRKVLAMYEGNNWDMDMWHLQPSGQYKVCTDLCSAVDPNWRYAPNISLMD